MKNFKKKSLIILCGSRETRLGALGKKIPKSLVKINSYLITCYIIDNLNAILKYLMVFDIQLIIKKI